MKLTLKEFLTPSETLILEGGNVSIRGIKPESIDISVLERDKVTSLLMQGFKQLNEEFATTSGDHLWKKSTLELGKIFSGSTRHLFDKDRSTADLLKHKPKFGDIDLMVDIDLLDALNEFFDNNKNEIFSTIKFIDYKKSGDQLITLFKILNLDLIVQIDFEGSEFHKKEPTEWAKFAHSSHFIDTANGIKGVFHKMLMTSLMAPKKLTSVEQLKTKQREIVASTHVLSIKGLREKYKTVGHDGDKPILVDTKSQEFSTDMVEILTHLFGKAPTDEDLENLQSFVGMTKLINKHLNRAQKEIVLNHFTTMIFGHNSQRLYRDDHLRDVAEKTKALEFLSAKIKVPYDEQEILRMKTEYNNK